MSVAEACSAAGFDRRTSFARARNLLERADVRSLVRAAILDEGAADLSGESHAAPHAADQARSDDPLAELTQSEGRIMREYEKIAFADASKEGDVKVADKLRALEQYRAIIERRAARSLADDTSAAAPILTVNYDYGDGGNE